MNNPSDSDALRYLLGEMDAESRAAWEERLQRDPAAQRELRDVQEALAAFALEAAPAETLPAADQRRALDRIMTIVDREPRRAAGLQPWLRWAWPLAAGLLFALNLWQFTHSVAEGPGGPPASTTNDATVVADRGVAVSEAGADADAAPDSNGAVASAQTGDVLELSTAGPINIGPEELRRLREIRIAYEQLAADHDRLRDEHTEILRQLAVYALTARGVNRVAAMELVDPESYAAGERKGLLEFALNLLTEPGIIALEPEAAVVGAGNDGGAGDPAVPGDAGEVDTANQTPNGGDALPAVGGDPLPADGGNDPQSVDDAGARDPYAWSVFDETQQRGFLNLYNLPTPPAGQTLQLWVRGATDDAYRRVGAVPEQYFGGSGSLTYQLPPDSPPPAEILITQEPINAPPGQPSGPPVLRGP